MVSPLLGFGKRTEDRKKHSSWYSARSYKKRSPNSWGSLTGCPLHATCHSLLPPCPSAQLTRCGVGGAVLVRPFSKALGTDWGAGAPVTRDVGCHFSVLLLLRLGPLVGWRELTQHSSGGRDQCEPRLKGDGSQLRPAGQSRRSVAGGSSANTLRSRAEIRLGWDYPQSSSFLDLGLPEELGEGKSYFLTWWQVMCYAETLK